MSAVLLLSHAVFFLAHSKLPFSVSWLGGMSFSLPKISNVALCSLYLWAEFKCGCGPKVEGLTRLCIHFVKLPQISLQNQVWWEKEGLTEEMLAVVEGHSNWDDFTGAMTLSAKS